MMGVAASASGPIGDAHDWPNVCEIGLPIEVSQTAEVHLNRITQCHTVPNSRQDHMTGSFPHDAMAACRQALQRSTEVLQKLPSAGYLHRLDALCHFASA
jgi:hypothetical protein